MIRLLSPCYSVITINQLTFKHCFIVPLPVPDSPGSRVKRYRFVKTGQTCSSNGLFHLSLSGMQLLAQGYISGDLIKYLLRDLHFGSFTFYDNKWVSLSGKKDNISPEIVLI